LVALAIPDIAAHTPSWGDQLRLVDSTPVPCAASRETVRRSALAGGHLGRQGLAGRELDQFVAAHGARLLRPDRADEPPRLGSLGRFRQWIESTFQTLKGQLGLERHGGRTLAGVWVRVGQRLLALATGIWWNWQLGVPDKRSLVAYDH
jgi:hypothetical protein